MIISAMVSATTSLDEPHDIESRVDALKSMGKIHRGGVAGVRISDIFNNVCNHLKVFAAHVLLLCWGHLYNRNGLG